MCKGKDDSETSASDSEDSASEESASASEEKEMSCEKLAHMRSEMLGMRAFDNSACDGVNADKVAEMETKVDEKISSSGCDVCAVYWAVLSDDSERGMGSGCKSRKSFGKGKGGSKGRFLQEDSAS